MNIKGFFDQLGQIRRYPSDGWFGGVCAGIAQFFGWRTKVVRIVAFVLFILMTGWIFIALYALAWYVWEDGDETPNRPRYASMPSGTGPSGGGAPSAAPASAADVAQLGDRYQKIDQRVRRLEEAALNPDAALLREFDALKGP